MSTQYEEGGEGRDDVVRVPAELRREAPQHVVHLGRREAGQGRCARRERLRPKRETTCAGPSAAAAETARRPARRGLGRGAAPPGLRPQHGERRGERWGGAGGEGGEVSAGRARLWDMCV